MSRRRGFGSIRRLPGGRYQVHYLDPTDGRRKPGPQTFATKTDASRWLAQLQTELGAGSYFDPRAGDIPFEKYATEWLTTKRDIRPTTEELYSYLLRSHVSATQAPTLHCVTNTPWNGEMQRSHRQWTASFADSGNRP